MIERCRSLVAVVRWMNPAGRVGLALLLLFGIVAGGFSWQVEPFKGIERQLYDQRASQVPETAAQDRRIALIAYTEETLRATGQQSPVDRGVLVRALASLDTMGGRAIVVDLLLDRPQPQDAELVAQLRGMRTPVYFPSLSAAESEGRDEGYEGVSYLRDFYARAGVTASRQVFTGVMVDDDDVVRVWPNTPTGLSLPAEALGSIAMTGYRGPIRFRLARSPDEPVIATYPIDLFTDPAVLADALAPAVAGRTIFIGIDSSSYDRFETPLRYTADAGVDATMSGTEIQAHMLTQALDGQRYWKPPEWFAPLLPLLILPLAMLTAALAMPPALRITLVIVQLASIAALPFVLEYLFEDSAGVGAFGWALCWIIGYYAVLMVRRAKSWEQGRIAQSALTRYLPPDIAAQILDDPTRLGLSGQRCHVFALFSDLEGFTGLCQSEQPTDVALFLNDYLETLSQVVLDHGGTIDKFVGDAVVAFWGAPLAREGDGERAAKAAVAIHLAGESFRSRILPGGGVVGRTRVGLHYGDAIVGNFGGDGRMQYTALGDTMNLAARLEGANKQLGTSILISRDAAKFAEGVVLRTMGRIAVRGRQAPVAVFEPGVMLADVDVARMNRLYDAAMDGEKDALAELQAWAVERDFDLGLVRLIERMAAVEEGGVTKLG